MEYTLFLCFILSFAISYLTVPFWIKACHRFKLTGADVHKHSKKKVAELGGIPILIGFIFGVFLYIGITTFFIEGIVAEQLDQNLKIMATLVTILIATLIGTVDDIFGWKIGLKQWQKPLLMLVAAVPIMVINAGESIIGIPLIGSVDIGILFPLVLIPIAITGTANGFNMIAGYNGLETGMGMIILTAMGYIAWINNHSWVTMLALCMAFALAGFYIFNKIPAKIFGGDSLTYQVGALIGCIAILGNMEKTALLIFTPYIFEFVLKARGKFKKESFGKLNKDGSLSLRYKKIYGLEHIIIALKNKFGKKAYEKDVLMGLFLIQFLFIILTFIYIF